MIWNLHGITEDYVQVICKRSKKHTFSEYVHAWVCVCVSVSRRNIMNLCSRARLDVTIRCVSTNLINLLMKLNVEEI
jgi:hypothetical protein